MPYVIDVRDFGAQPGGPDCTLALGRAAAACAGRRAVTLVLPPGRYAISRPHAAQTTLGISNHEPSQFRRVALHLAGCDGLTLRAEGAELIASGQVVPLLIEGGRDIAIHGLTIDWSVPLHAWGEVVGAWNGWLDVRPTGGHPWRIIRERLCFLVDGQPEECWGTYAMDAATLTPAVGSGDHCGSAWTLPWVAEDLGEGIVRLRTHLVVPPTPGQLVLLRHGVRIAPGIAAHGVTGLRLQDVTIRQAGGMALIVQRSTDPVVERLRVQAGVGRPLSANYDATHFLSCRGTVRLEGCTFERQLDDGTNIHGMNLPIMDRAGERTLLARIAHPEQRGCVVAEAGERFAVIDPETMQAQAEFRAARVRPLNAEYVEIDADGVLPEAARGGRVIESLDADAGAIVRDCRIAHHRARGLLFACRGRVQVERSTFVTPGPAIHLHGDMASWYESGAVTEIVLRGNRFERCGYARTPHWGTGVISVQPELRRFAGAYHGRVVVEGNTFSDCVLPAVRARAAAAVIVRGNQGLRGPDDVQTDDCAQVEVTDAP